jgi:hypothetical protein
VHGRPQSYSRTYSDSFGRDRRRAGKPLRSATAFSRVSARYCVPADQPRDGPFRASIFGGTRPADLPFEEPTRYKLVINLKIAKTTGIELPMNFVALADEVIE